MSNYQSVFALFAMGYHAKDFLHSMSACREKLLLRIFFPKWQLHPQLLCGQAYDGAGAMAGKSKGAASRIMQKYPKALYAAHLCVMKCCSIREVSNMMDTADKISRFFNNSPKLHG